MKKLFLSSSFVDVAKCFADFVKEAVKGKSVTFIPTASNTESYTAYVDKDKEAFKELGIAVHLLDVSISSKEEIQAAVDKHDYIYVSGGNTFYLLQELGASGADHIISNAVTSGKVYIGASAGSVVMAPDIAYLQLMDDVSQATELENFKGLGLVDFFPIPHHTNEPFKQAVEAILLQYNDKIPLVAISNTEVIQVEGEGYSIYGHK